MSRKLEGARYGSDLQHPIAVELLQSKIPVRLAYLWTDGSPRVVPIWFHWNGSEFVLGTAPQAPKLKALVRDPRVSLTIDDNIFPHKVLLVRGEARLETVKRYRSRIGACRETVFRTRTGSGLGCAVEQNGFVHGAGEYHSEVGGLLDFQTRFPSALSH
jgi:Pyridoxamine 5'-phosphate oxidase